MPLLFWSAAYVAWVYLFHGYPLSPRDVAARLLSGAPYSHLHFLFIIAGLYALTPVLRPFARHASRGELALMSAILLAAASCGGVILAIQNSQPNAFTRFYPYIGYFLAGLYLRDVEITGRRALAAAAGFVVTAAATAGTVYFLNARSADPRAGLIAMDYLSPAVVVMSICAFIMIRRLDFGRASRWFDRLGAVSFGVYLVHPMVLDIIARALAPLGVRGVWLDLALVPAAFAASAAVVALLLRLPVVKRTVA